MKLSLRLLCVAAAIAAPLAAVSLTPSVAKANPPGCQCKVTTTCPTGSIYCGVASCTDGSSADCYKNY